MSTQVAPFLHGFSQVHEVPRIIMNTVNFLSIINTEKKNIGEDRNFTLFASLLSWRNSRASGYLSVKPQFFFLATHEENRER